MARRFAISDSMKIYGPQKGGEVTKDILPTMQPDSAFDALVGTLAVPNSKYTRAVDLTTLPPQRITRLPVAGVHSDFAHTATLPCTGSAVASQRAT